MVHNLGYIHNIKTMQYLLLSVHKRICYYKGILYLERPDHRCLRIVVANGKINITHIYAETIHKKAIDITFTEDEEEMLMSEDEEIVMLGFRLLREKYK